MQINHPEEEHNNTHTQILTAYHIQTLQFEAIGRPTLVAVHVVSNCKDNLSNKKKTQNKLLLNDKFSV